MYKDILAHDGTTLIDWDIWLSPYRQHLIYRHQLLKDRLKHLSDTATSLKKYSLGHTYFGFTTKGDTFYYREWAPEALQLALIGDFNNWDNHAHPMKKDANGVWSLEIPKSLIKPNSHLKVSVTTINGTFDKIPAYAQKVEYDHLHKCFYAVYKPDRFRWKHPRPQLQSGLKIYETHIGIAQEEGKVSSFAEFTQNVLPRIKQQGYNAIQIMGLAQHPYYGSFGYQVSNFFAVSHFFGSKVDLKKLVDEAHNLGIAVLMDLVHSHFVSNVDDGLNFFDGTDYQYSHKGSRGNHPAWGTKLFNYGKPEVIHFLLSNIHYWLEEFNLDGFRFDGVTSMVYLDHGLNKVFDHYDGYFYQNIDEDALVYLKLANLLVHEIYPQAITIAEDVSGMPGLARPVYEGGIGFDYRLAMGLPDYWIEILKHQSDPQWQLKHIFDRMLDRRYGEKHIAYCESHDQALVGDKTIAFRLMDQDMYWHMQKNNHNLVIDRGIALHKLIRLLTFSLGGEAWLNFMGNEFGHPEWLDFPREGNNYSYHFARRQWSLVDNPDLRYQELNNFDQAMQSLDNRYNLLNDEFLEYITDHEEDKVLVYRRGALVFAFNFHHQNSYTDYRIGVPDMVDYRLCLNSDLTEFGGFNRIDPDQKYIVQNISAHNRNQSIQIYIPSRTALVFVPVNHKP